MARTQASNKVKGKSLADSKSKGLIRYSGWIKDMLNGNEPNTLEEVKAWRFDAKKKDEFLEALQEEFGIVLACGRVGVSPQVVAYHCKNDTIFRRAVDRVHSEHAAMLERSMFGRALSSSDTLAIFMAKNIMPDRYGEGVKDGDVNVKVTVNLGVPETRDITPEKP